MVARNHLGEVVKIKVDHFQLDILEVAKAFVILQLKKKASPRFAMSQKRDMWCSKSTIPPIKTLIRQLNVLSKIFGVWKSSCKMLILLGRLGKTTF